MRRVRWTVSAVLGLVALGCVEPVPDDGFERREGLFRVVILPDTQCYARRFPEILEAQGDWVAASVDDLDIRMVVHLGDITDTNDAAEWEVARGALAPILDRVPLALSPGNHDLGAGGSAADRSSMLAAFFPLDAMAAAPGFVESYGGTPGNTAWLFSGELHEYVWIGVEFAPRDDVVTWVRDVLAAHPDRIGIVSTHAYLDAAGRRYDHTDSTVQEFCPYEYGVSAVDGNDGEELFTAAIAPSPNARMVWSGHVPNGFAYAADVNGAGSEVHQVMADYQTGTRCPETGGDGNGFLLVLEIEEQEASVSVRVRSYSPWLGQHREDHEVTFTIAPP